MSTDFTIEHQAGPHIKINGSEFIFFGGTNYLGIASHPVFQENLIQALKKYGTTHGASRNNNLKLAIFKEFENHLAKKYGFEAAAVTSSGLLAGQLSMAALSGKKIYAPGTHPAIKPSGHLPADYENNFRDFSKHISSTLKNASTPLTIASNAVDNLFCNKTDFTWIDKIPDGANVNLLIDYSHGIGISDIDPFIVQAKNKFNTIVAASLAKAIGIPAGIILGNKKTIKKIKENPLFIGASPAPPAFLEAYLRSEKIYEEQKEKLNLNIDYFNQHNRFPFRNLPNYPVYFTEENIFKKLFRQRIFVSNFSYPESHSPLATRVVLSAAHTIQDLKKLIDALAKK